MHLGEGRQRYHSDDLELSEDPTRILWDRLTRAEREKVDVIREKEDIMREKEDMMREKEDIMRKQEDMLRKQEDMLRKIAELEKGGK